MPPFVLQFEHRVALSIMNRDRNNYFLLLLIRLISNSLLMTQTDDINVDHI